MDAALSILATLALLASSVISLALAHGTKGFSMRTPGGPDSMGIIVFFIGSLAAWGLTLIGAALTALRGAFAWLATPPAAAVVLLLLILIALAFLSILALGASLENRLKHRQLYGCLGALLLPIAANAFTSFLAWADPVLLAPSIWPRLAALPFGLLAAGSVITAGSLYLRAQARAADRIAERAKAEQDLLASNSAEAIQRDIAHRAELEALPDDAPLCSFVSHLFIDKSDAHHALALARIAALPDLAARFNRELEHPDPLAREYLLNSLRVMPSLDPSLQTALAPTIARCFERLAADLAWLASDTEHRAHRHARGMTLGLLLTSQKFPDRFEDPARRLRDAFDAWPNASTREAAQQLLDHYLRGEPVPA